MNYLYSTEELSQCLRSLFITLGSSEDLYISECPYCSLRSSTNSMLLLLPILTVDWNSLRARSTDTTGSWWACRRRLGTERRGRCWSGTRLSSGRGLNSQEKRGRGNNSRQGEARLWRYIWSERLLKADSSTRVQTWAEVLAMKWDATAEPRLWPHTITEAEGEIFFLQ